MEASQEHIIEEPTEIEKRSGSKNLPLLLKAVALLLVVYGIIGLIYYLLVAVYSAGNSDFLRSLEYNDYREEALFIPLIVEILVHIAAILGGFLIIFRKKQGPYYFYFAFIISMVFSFFFLGRFNSAEMIIASIILIIILIYRKRIALK